GTRLWPRSRVVRPKQFLDLISPATMLQEARNRLDPLIPAERTIVVTGAGHREAVAEQLPGVLAENILGEPEARGTAAAIGLAAAYLRKRDPGSAMAVLTADHLIARTEVFRAALDAAARVATDGWLVTLGIEPAYPETGYGYIERGDVLPISAAFSAYAVARFEEKPERLKAEEFVRSGRHSWNSGMFIWRVDRILAEMRRQLPDLRAGLDTITDAVDTPDEAATMAAVWPTLPKTTIDYGVMEHAERVAVIPVEIGWNDVGSWSSVYDVLPKDDDENAVVGQHLNVDSRGNLIYSPHRLVATIGLDNLIVVDTDDAILICPRDRAQDVKAIVARLQQDRKPEYL
ncbi:MAG TPA: sugar phosphate nucleotidyltransferase, partial [Chloroflexota bacterium]|nr:sugar phosphate nucleotidyltransferase [Chloroflexota bacterium]